MQSNFLNKNKIADLPVYKYEKEIIYRLNKENVLVIVGETGSGKTTQIPKIIYNHNLCSEKVICVTQPRRVAAISVALRVSKEVSFLTYKLYSELFSIFYPQKNQFT